MEFQSCRKNSARVSSDGLQGDGRNHAKHIRPDRAISLWDHENLQQLVAEGFQLTPGAAGENFTVSGLNVQQMPPGTLLRIGDVVLKLEQPRKPCYVLDAIDPRLKDVIVGRCGYMASVRPRRRTLSRNATSRSYQPTTSIKASASVPAQNEVESSPRS